LIWEAINVRVLSDLLLPRFWRFQERRVVWAWRLRLRSRKDMRRVGFKLRVTGCGPEASGAGCVLRAIVFISVFYMYIVYCILY
jgi:hypothetical protein